MKRTRILALLLAAFLLMTSAGALADVPDNMNETGLPIAKEMTTYTVMLKLNEGEDGRWEDLELMKWLEEKTNVHFEYDVYPDDEIYREQLGLMFMAGNYADVLMPRSNQAVWWQDDEEYGREGYLIDMKPLIEQYMPNAQKVFEEYPALKGGQTAGNGAMYGLPFYYFGGVGGNPHLWYMEPYWLEVAGWDDVPNTIDEMKKLMYDIKAVMDSGEYERPEENMYVMGIQNQFGITNIANVVLAAYTGSLCSPDEMPFAVPDGKTVEFMVYHPGFRKTVEFFAEMYQNGLINPDVFTMDNATWAANKNGGKYAMFIGSSSAMDPELIRDRTLPGREEQGYYGCMAIRPMTSELNDTPKVNFETLGSINQLLITDKCENPEIIARWADLFYNMDYDITDNDTPNPLMFFKGFYDVHWKYTDEERRHWTFLDRPDGSTGEDGSTIIDWMYSRNYLVPGWSLPCGIYIDDSFADGSPMYISKQVTNDKNMYPYCTTDTQFPPMARMSDEEVDKVATKVTDLREYIREQWGLFMSGQQELNDDSWAAFVAECENIGVEEITGVYQDVYDRWMEALS